ncbi:hypothetical protein MES5069_740035 [Mesorhizobium escarrei]|uniref:Uncharacterized protein n=1 Tax=Mesorhizobium escarrei TaxID=666018 RepID=A0ABN8KI84_9HYPH|nr:hypothetical protein MES5069_740035 [Mesorhizobium escarrei]
MASDIGNVRFRQSISESLCTGLSPALVNPFAGKAQKTRFQRMLESGFVATGRGGGPPGLYQHMREVLVPGRVAFGSCLAFHTLRADGACKDDGRTPSKVDSEQAGNVGSSPAAPTNRGFV